MRSYLNDPSGPRAWRPWRRRFRGRRRFGGRITHCRRDPRDIGLPMDPGCAEFYKSEAPVRTASNYQVREPVNAKGLGRWRRFEAELAPLIAELSAAGALAQWDA